MKELGAIMQLKNMDFIIYMIKMIFIISLTYYGTLKISNKKQKKKNRFFLIICIVIMSIICTMIYYVSNYLCCVIWMVMLLSLFFAKLSESNIGYSILTTIIALSINYILYFMAIIITFIPSVFLNVKNDYINLAIIILIDSIFVCIFYKIKKFKYGFSFLEKEHSKEYFDMLILNISMIILFCSAILSNYNLISSGSFFFSFIIFAIIMFITIQKSLQLYYKQKLLIQDLNETKKELGEKKQEIKQLEKEILSFSKTSHSIVHEQKLLKYKLDELMLKNEMAVEIDIRDRINNISKEICKEAAVVELFKTGISEIDNVLEYMQSECVKNKIDFQVQINGNIHYMMNHYIAKENLKILLADHIKNAIIAINYSKNRNKSILVRLGKIEGIYSLYVYDSGIEFEIETLLNLGKKPMTTHRDDGGTGMGFMNTFDTLKEHKASMTIYEYSKPKEEDFTKLIMIKFDKKNEFKICSYRSEEIKKEDDIGNLTIEKIEN